MRRSQGVATYVGDYDSQKTTPCDLKLSPFAGQKKYEAKVHISNTNMEKEKNTAGGNSGDQDAWPIPSECDHLAKSLFTQQSIHHIHISPI